MFRVTHPYNERSQFLYTLAFHLPKCADILRNQT